MIAIETYQTQIGKYDLYNLVTGKRYDQPGDSEPDISEPLELAEASAQSIIQQRFGYLPVDTDFLNTATVAGVMYLLSRKPHNQIDQDVIDQRRQTFFDMLPARPGAEGRAEIKIAKSKLGRWL